MSLKTLISNKDNFEVGITTDSQGNPLLNLDGTAQLYKNTTIQHGGPSKGIKYGANVGGRSGEKDPPKYHLVDRVEWYGSDKGSDGHEPTYLLGVDHKSSTNDFMLRGGDAFYDRRDIDRKRINNFLYDSPQGNSFLMRQGALQLLNPQVNTRTFNGGASLLASVASAGVTSFKRAGLIPEPVDFNFNSSLGGLLSGGTGFMGAVGNFASNVLGGDYISLIGTTHRETPGVNKSAVQGYGLGSPGKNHKKGLFGEIIDLTFGGNPFAKKQSYSPTLKSSIESNQVDLLNMQNIFKAPDGNIPLKINGKNIHSKDFVNFRFEVIDSDNPIESNYILFRAFLDSFNDNFNATHNEVKYNGRGEQFYTYNSFKRGINISFKIAAQSRHEMKPLYRKLNYLAAQTAPNYSPTVGRIRTPYMKLTMGDYFNRIPGVLTSVIINWQKDYPWEIRLDPDGKDKEMLILPHVLDVSVVFQPIHAFTPTNDHSTPYIGIDKWAKEGIETQDDPIIGDTEDASALYQESFTDDQGNAIGESDLPGNPSSV